MRSFITLAGGIIDVTGTHEEHAERVMHSNLGRVLSYSARVHVHNKHFVLETNQTHLSMSQKIRAGKIYKEYGCIGWTVQVNGRYSTSNMQDCEHRINWSKVKQIG